MKKINNIQIHKKNKLAGIIFFAIAILFKGIGDAFFVKTNLESKVNLIKYIFLILSSLILFFNMPKKTENKIFKKEFNILVLAYVIISIISIIFSILNEKFTFRSIKEILFIMIPIVFTYIALNTLTNKEIENMAKYAVIVYLISYLVEIRTTFSISYFINSIKHFSLTGGQSTFAYDALESSAFPDPMMALFCYFIYNNKNNNKWILITYISILMMNKRLIILFSTILLILNYIPFTNKMLKKKCSNTTYITPLIIFSIMPLILMKLTSPDIENYILNKFNINMRDFWMGRDDMVQYMLNNNFKSYGLGSTYDFREKLLEIESLKFYLETSILGTTIISYCYWKIANKNIYTILVMFYIFLNISTSTSIITGAFALIYYLFLMGGIEKNGIEKN